MTRYPHRFYPPTATTAEGPCDCGAIRPARGDCPAALRAALDTERRAVVAYLRGMADRYDREGTAATLATAARDIEAGAHTTTEGAPDADPR